MPILWVTEALFHRACADHGGCFALAVAGGSSMRELQLDRVSPAESEPPVVRLRCPDGGSFADHVAALRDLACSPELAPGIPVLLDVRDVTLLPNPAEAEVLAGLLANQGVLGRHRVAVVVNAGTQYGVARMVCTLAELRGADGKVFTEQPQALSWLVGAAEIQQE